MVCVVTLLVFFGCPQFIEVLMQKLNDEKTSVEPCCKIGQNKGHQCVCRKIVFKCSVLPLPPVPTFISVPNAYMHLHHCKFVGCTYVVIVGIKLN
jgi:hypothetical protein